MASLINVEKSQYLNQNIDSYTTNKVGQYSKFLEKNPIFVTWLSINNVETRTDVGTGGVMDEIGPKSPIRYNCVKELPVYNIPDLKPQSIYEEQGYDIELELSDAVLLPGTIIPQVGDFLILTLPNSYEVAFQVNAFDYNSIQSRDFYLFSAHAKYTAMNGDHLLKRFMPQIVDSFSCVFDNIGTEDKCLLRDDDLDEMTATLKLLTELTEMYRKNFFDKTTGNFVCTNNDENPNKREKAEGFWLYDKYVERFILDSQIYFDQTGVDTCVFAPGDLLDPHDRVYVRTLFYAVLKKDTAFLCRYPWYFQDSIHRVLSTFIVNHIPCKSVVLHLTDYPLIYGQSDGLDSTYLLPYFPHRLIHEIIDTNDAADEGGGDGDDEDDKDFKHCYYYKNYADLPKKTDSVAFNPTNIDTNVEGMTRAQIIAELNANSGLSSNSSNDTSSSTTPDEPVVEPTEETHEEEEPKVDYDEKAKDSEYEYTYLDEIIFAYLTGQTPSIDRKKLVKFALQVNNYVYRAMPLVIYIVKQYYLSYFKGDLD